MRYFFRFCFRAFAVLATCLSTAALSAFATLRASELNAFHPAGFCSAMIASPLFDAHESRVVLTRQDAISQTLARNLTERFFEPHEVVCDAVVESKNLLRAIPEQMERRDGNVRSTQRPLEKRKEILAPVNVDMPRNVSSGVVDRIMRMSYGQRRICSGCISVDRGPMLYVAANCGDQFGRVIGADNVGSCLAHLAALQHCLDDCLANCPAPLDDFLASALVHVGRFSPDVSCVGFIRPVEFVARYFHRCADSVDHKPRGLLLDPYIAGKLIAADSIFAIGDQPDREKPFVESDFARLKNRPNATRELLFAVPAFEHSPCLDFSDADAFRSASRTRRRAVAPTNPAHVFFAAVQIGKINRGLLESHGSVVSHLVSPTKAARPDLCVGCKTDAGRARERLVSHPNCVAAVNFWLAGELIRGHVEVEDVASLRNRVVDVVVGHSVDAASLATVGVVIVFGPINPSLIATVLRVPIDRHFADLSCRHHLVSPALPGCLCFAGSLSPRCIDYIGYSRVRQLPC